MYMYILGIPLVSFIGFLVKKFTTKEKMKDSIQFTLWSIYTVPLIVFLKCDTISARSAIVVFTR